MSIKGKKFSHADLPRLTQQRITNKQLSDKELAKISAHLEAQTERNKIVARDPDTGQEFIAEELHERAMRKHADGDSDVLVHLRNLSALDPVKRKQVLESFDKKGELKIPFEKVK